MQRNTLIFYKQSIFKQLALGWQIAEQLSGFNSFSLSNNHSVKTVCIRSYSGPHFSRIFPHSDWILRDTYSELFWFAFFPDFPAFGLNTERYRVSLRKSGENEDQNNSEYRLFLRSVFHQKFLTKWLNE